MAETQSNARLRADAGAQTSGVIHVRTRLTAGFTVIANALAQRRGSAVTIGVAAYILSLPDGTPVTIAALCEHFTEGEILISRALKELERAGHLERRRERGPSGHIRTRTYFHDLPCGGPGGPNAPGGPGGPRRRHGPDGPDGSEPPKPPRPRKPPADEAPPATATAIRDVQDVPETAAVREEPQVPTPSLAEADPRAVAVLASLRRVDPRLILSGQEAARLAPAVARWLASGLLPTEITEHLTAGLPAHLLTRPASILAYRLKETPLSVPTRTAGPGQPRASAEPGARPAVVPLKNCDGCDRGFRSADPDLCRGCRDRQDYRDHRAEEPLRAAG
ncbi:hypothetical protein OG352_23790 [Streptomyces sp. NBC_01485]|uniref:hypothetical protein n=1 Tax=Streptomyces sp. NBC_01485 TaxID=2903884 RepID=UPI002E35BD4E|nr:hypothetical protein [Streptomyces sp. NBC_01485]